MRGSLEELWQPPLTRADIVPLQATKEFRHVGNTKHEAGLLAMQQRRGPTARPPHHPGCGVSQSTPCFLPAPATGISLRTKAQQHVGPRGHANLVPAQSRDGAKGVCWGPGGSGHPAHRTYLPAQRQPGRSVTLKSQAEILCWLNRKSLAEISGTSHVIEVTGWKCLNPVRCVHITGEQGKKMWMAADGCFLSKVCGKQI